MIDLLLRVPPIPPIAVVTLRLSVLSLDLIFMKERIKFYESSTIKVDLNNCLRCISVLIEMLSFFPIKECRLYSCGNVDGKTSAG